MDNLILALKEVSMSLLPIFGMLVLLFLIILLYRLIKMITRLESTFNEVEKSIKTANTYLEEMEAPVKTVLRISKNIDLVQNATENILKTVIDYLVDNFEPIKNAIVSKFKKSQQEE